MPPSTLVNLDLIDSSRTLYDKARIYEELPQRHEFAQLDRIVYYDADERILAAVREVRADEWWCRGHIPGKPIFPGVLMVECAAQLAVFAMHRIQPGFKGFVAFGGIDNAKFRDSVTPPSTVLLVGRAVEIRPRRVVCDVQAFVEGRMVFEGRITGMRVPL
jgi:3-hydroxyacyl-[acyl-carrier-protein] dehydratase